MSRKTASADNDVLDRARAIIAAPLDISVLLEKVGVRENSALARRLAACEQTSPKRAGAWKRLASLLITLAPARPKPVQRAIQFYIPDGKYQQQVFALDDAADGTLAICCENILPQALSLKLLVPERNNPGRYLVAGGAQAVVVEQLDGKTENPPAYCSAMTGWNRLAIRIILPSDPSKEQISTAEMLCAISSLRWQPLETAEKLG